MKIVVSRNCLMQFKNTKDSAPGHDNVSAKMLKSLPENAQQFLLQMINKFWSESYIPEQ